MPIIEVHTKMARFWVRVAMFAAKFRAGWIVRFAMRRAMDSREGDARLDKPYVV